MELIKLIAIGLLCAGIMWVGAWFWVEGHIFIKKNMRNK